MGIINNKNIIYNNSKTFFWASIFLPKRILNKVINIYSFCRTYDDIVDEGLPITSSQDAQKLEEIIKSYGISQNLIDELISGINSDVNFKRYKNNDELLRYCYKVAGVGGLMMSQALEIKNLEAKYFAIDLGIAMQLTNIARDVVEDKKINREYIKPDFENIQATVKLAEMFYESSFSSIQKIPFKYKFSIIVARRIYRQIGRKILQKGSMENYEKSGKIYINNFEKTYQTIISIFDLILIYIFQAFQKSHFFLRKYYLMRWAR